MKTMKWMATKDEEKMLHINIGSGFKPYTAFPDLMQPDTRMAKGFRTAQVLLSKGYVYEPCDR